MARRRWDRPPHGGAGSVVAVLVTVGTVALAVSSGLWLWREHRTVLWTACAIAVVLGGLGTVVDTVLETRAAKRRRNGARANRTQERLLDLRRAAGSGRDNAPVAVAPDAAEPGESDAAGDGPLTPADREESG